MGKTYVDTVKYMIKANYEIDGLVEKPDIVGAIFGQTEGLLGDELDLRELQRNARISVTRVEDSRNLKRKSVLERAKVLLKALVTEEIPESKELSEMVRDEVKVADVVSYGKDALPAGPGIDKSNEIIVVEGRADVINLLKNGIKNV